MKYNRALKNDGIWIADYGRLPSALKRFYRCSPTCHPVTFEVYSVIDKECACNEPS